MVDTFHFDQTHANTIGNDADGNDIYFADLTNMHTTEEKQKEKLPALQDKTTDLHLMREGKRCKVFSHEILTLICVRA